MGALVIELIGLNVALLFAPLFLIYLVVGAYLHPDNVGFAKTIIGVLFPLLFMVWFAGIVVWWDSWKDEDGNRVFSDGPNMRSVGLGIYFAFMAYLGVFLSLMWNLTGLDSLYAMLVGLFSPVLLYVIGRLTTMWVTGLTSVAITIFTLHRFLHGFGWV